MKRYAESMVESRLGVLSALLLSVVALVSVSACKSHNSGEAEADSTEQPVSSAEPGGHRKHELPPAAFDACQGKGVGDACTVQFKDKQFEAKCAAVPDGRLACRREHKKPEGS
jgi:hypothetical protein